MPKVLGGTAAKPQAFKDAREGTFLTIMNSNFAKRTLNPKSFRFGWSGVGFNADAHRALHLIIE